MITPLLQKLIDLGLVAPYKGYRLARLGKDFYLVGHNAMQVIVSTSEGWLTVKVAGETFGSFRIEDERNALVAFIGLTFESTNDYAKQWLAEKLSISPVDTGTATVALNYGLLNEYLNTEDKRRAHLRGIRLDSMFHELVITVHGRAHVYENRAGGWFKLRAARNAKKEGGK